MKNYSIEGYILTCNVLYRKSEKHMNSLLLFFSIY